MILASKQQFKLWQKRRLKKNLGIDVIQTQAFLGSPRYINWALPFQLSYEVKRRSYASRPESFSAFLSAIGKTNSCFPPGIFQCSGWKLYQLSCR